MDWSEKNLCIKCNGGENLLVCGENGCPLAIHRGCMGCPARFDDENHFYCPYCLYKRAVTESRQAREYALARKKALLNFMAGDMTSAGKQSEVNEGDEANGRNQSRVNEENVNIAKCGDDRVNGAEEENALENEINEKEILDEGQGEASAASGQNPSVKMHQHKEKILEDGSKTLSDTSDQDTLPLRERAKRASKQRKTIDGNSEAVSVKSKFSEKSDKNNNQSSPLVNSPRRSSRRSSSGFRTEEVKSGKNVEAPKSLRKNEVNGHDESIFNEENANIVTCGDDTDKVNGAEKDKVPEEKISNEKGIQDEEDDEASAASSDQSPSLKMHEHEEKIQEVVSDSSGQETLPLRERIRIKRESSKRMKTMDGKSGVGSVKSKHVEESDKNNKQTSPTVNSPRRSPRKPSSGLRTEVKSGKKVEVPKSLRKNELPSVKLVNDTLIGGKRKRLLWSEEEEDALKAGVQKYLNEPKINVPWRRILDMGRKVFDGTRTPSDLKDKWRNMSEK